MNRLIQEKTYYMMMPSFLLLLLVLLTKSSSASNNGLSDELRFIHQQMGSLREENQKQSMEIFSLKETVQLQNKTINQHEETIKELINDDRPVSSGVIISRRKRPARLLPSSILRGKKKNETIEEENRNIFYGPPTNCSDLARLGYTLNGFYQVKNTVGNENFPQATEIETVYCAFKQEGAYNPLNVQKPVIPSPFPPLNPFPSSFFSSPSLKSDEGISFSIQIVRNKNNPYYGTLTFPNAPGSNVGDHFNTKTGYFKSPNFGIYHFSYEMNSFDIRVNETNVNFYMNDIPVNNTFSLFSENPGQSMIVHQVTLKLKLGDTICLKAVNKDNSKYVSTKAKSFSESIMGYLLKAASI